MRFAVLSLLLAACVEPTYPLSFRCTQGSAACPADRTCPTLPLGASACNDVPGLFEHAPIHLDAGRPPGCVVALPYGNPYYGNSQQSCVCTQYSLPDAGPDAGFIPPPSPPMWECPL